MSNGSNTGKPQSGSQHSLATRAIAWLVVHLHVLIVLAWAVGAYLAATNLPDLNLVSRSLFSGAVPSSALPIHVERRDAELFPFPVIGRTLVVQRDPNGLAPLAQARVFVRAVQLNFQELPGLERIAGAIPVTNTFGVFPSSRENGTTAITYLLFQPEVNPRERERLAREFVARYLDQTEDSPVGLTGTLVADDAQTSQINSTRRLVEVASVVLVALIVGLTFRSIMAPVVAICAAAIAYFTSLHVLALVGSHVGVGLPTELEPLIIVLLVGVMTDYTIFFLSEFRHRLAREKKTGRAAQQAITSVIPLVAAAGTTVAGSTAVLLVARLSVIQALGPGLAFTVLVGTAVAITFVPAALALLGRFVFWPAGVPRRIEDDRSEGRAGCLRHVTRWFLALPILALGIVLLVWAALPLRTMRLGVNLISDLPGDVESALAARAAAAGFAPGIIAPTEVLLTEDGIGNRTEGLRRLQGLIAQQPGVAGVLGPADVPDSSELGVAMAPDGNAARYIVIFADDPYGSGAIRAFQSLREMMPALTNVAGVGTAEVGYAGDTAISEVLVSTVQGDLIRVGIAMLVVDLAILVVFLRALVAPVFLLLASLLVVLTSLGATTWLFLDVLGVDSLTLYVPIAAIVLLIAFGSDYNIFVVGRLWEVIGTRSLREAIVLAGSESSSAISRAGVTLALTFALLAVIPLLVFREFAFVMFVGILLDTFFVRTFLVPTLLSILGRWSAWPNHKMIETMRFRTTTSEEEPTEQPTPE